MRKKSALHEMQSSGGKATLKKYGKEHYSKLGKKVLRKYGKDHFKALASARWKKEKATK